MTKRDVERRLAGAFPGPDRERKRAFFRRMPAPPVRHTRMVLVQAGYVSPLTWAASLGVFAGAMALGRLIPADALWTAAALTPFAALAAAAESGRSARCAMEELELSSRLGLKSVVLARMGAVGLVHLALLAALAAALADGGFFRAGVYFLTPYLLTDLLCLAAVRRVPGREGLLVCAGAAALTAGLALALHSVRGAYAPDSFRWWVLALAVTAGLTGREHIRTIRKLEELSWNL